MKSSDNAANLRARFDSFHAENPHVYDELLRLARLCKAFGRKRIGMKMLWEVCRWNLALRTGGEGGFKLNNSFTAYYARTLMEREPELSGIFETRVQRGEARTESSDPPTPARTPTAGIGT